MFPKDGGEEGVFPGEWDDGVQPHNSPGIAMEEDSTGTLASPGEFLCAVTYLTIFPSDLLPTVLPDSRSS